jgi:nicastrin
MHLHPPLLPTRPPPCAAAVDRTVVVPAASLADLASKLQTEPSYKQHIKGILVDARQAPASDSSAPTFPGAAYSLYPPAGYAWNPSGNGLNRQWFGIPMYALTDALAAEAEERAAYNQANSFSGTLYQAYMSLKMEAKLNSTNCLANGNCLPLGGHSVWAAMPPINPNETDSKPITLVVAQVDSNDVFHDLVQVGGAGGRLLRLRLLLRC